MKSILNSSISMRSSLSTLKSTKFSSLITPLALSKTASASSSMRCFMTFTPLMQNHQNMMMFRSLKQCQHQSRNCTCTLLSSTMLKRSFANSSNDKPPSPPSNSNETSQKPSSSTPTSPETSETQSPASRVISSPATEYYFNKPKTPQEIAAQKESQTIQSGINVALVVMAPLALYFPPGFFSSTVDIVFTFAIPPHMYFGLTGVVEDYVPRNLQKLANVGVGIIIAIATYGILKINMCGPGLIATFRSLWVKPQRNNLSQLK